MWESFCMGGWGMYPTLFFGVLALGAAVRYALDPGWARLLLVGILSAVNLTAGTLGCITGIITSIMYAHGLPNQWSLIAQGTAESLHCVALSLMLIVLTGIVAAVGAFRTPGRKPELSGARVPVTS